MEKKKGKEKKRKTSILEGVCVARLSMKSALLITAKLRQINLLFIVVF